MGRRSAVAAVVVVGGIAAAIALAVTLMGEPERPAELASDGDAAADPVDASPEVQALGWLAPAGHLVRATDAVPGSVLRILTADAGGDSRLCTVGRETGHTPLGEAVCRALGEEAARAEWDRLQGVSAETRATLTALGGQAVQLDGPVLWLEPAGRGRERWMARGADDGAPPVAVGSLPAGGERIRGCRTADALVAVVDGELVHGFHRVDVAFLTAEGWSAPVSETVAITEYTLGCHGTTASLSWLTVDADEAEAWLIHRVRCTPAGCERAEVTVPGSGSDPLLADLADRALLVWAEEGATRIALAPLEALGETTTLEGMPAPTGPILSRHLWVRGDAAVLALRTPRGITAAHILSDGTVHPLPVQTGGGG